MGYDNEDERAAYAGEEPNQKSRRKLYLIILLSVALIAIVLAVAIPVGIALHKQSQSSNSQPTGSAAIDAACQATSYPASCNQTLSGSSPQGYSRMAVEGAQNGINRTTQAVYAAQSNQSNPNVTKAVDVCLEVLDLSFDRLNLVLAALESGNDTAIQSAFDDIMCWASAAMEFHTTCLDALNEVGYNNGTVFAVGSQTNEFLSNCLALVNAFIKYGGDLGSWAKSAETDLSSLLPGNSRRLLEAATVEEDVVGESFPAWMDAEQRRHLLSSQSYNVKVAKDGSGNYRTIQAAVDNAPHHSTRRYVIYITPGTYNEQVNVPSSCWNLMLIGDSASSTVITNDKSVGLTRNMTTFRSGTLIVGGDGFCCKGISIFNTAGSYGNQAVAVRGSGDKIAFYQCTIDAWQDTLYAHTQRQFYRNCIIRGTVDFIFGNSQSVFQNCQIVAKKTTLVGQQNTYTAQGKTDRHQTTGLSFQSCSFEGTPDLINSQVVPESNNKFQTYLGRPWKQYSTCVLLQSTLGGHIDPAGWLFWNASSYGLYTSYFAEYQSNGQGAKPASRVSWSHQITKATDADRWQAGQFIQAGSWVASTGVPVTVSNF